ncbi:stress response protein nst1-like, partial [Manduca sexta]|uniref:stress response protein nst1-like n=1 Tax=Manduca sexta TaxID=7130 RepID=UPI0018909C3D
IAATKEALDAKMETHEEKREAFINELRARLKDHLEGVEKTRLTLEQQTAEVYKAIEDKMTTAADKRDENIKKMLERLREHEEQVRKVRAGNQERFQQLESAIQEKLQQAADRRLLLEAEQKEKLRNHNIKLAEVRSAATAKVEEITKDIETKLTTAEQNREKEIQKKLDFVKKEERRAELVRQNKSARTESGAAAESSRRRRGLGLERAPPRAAPAAPAPPRQGSLPGPDAHGHAVTEPDHRLSLSDVAFVCKLGLTPAWFRAARLGAPGDGPRASRGSHPDLSFFSVGLEEVRSACRSHVNT